MDYLSRHRVAIYGLVLPAFLFYCVYLIAPIFMSVYYSFTNSSIGANSVSFVGLGNYISLFTQDPVFLISLKNTIIIVVLSLLIMLPISFFLAVMFQKRFRGSSILMGLNIMPVVISPIIIGVIWTFILDPQNGFLNLVLRRIGLKWLALQWIGGPVLSPYTISVVYAWQFIGLLMLILLAGLRGIPEDIFDASKIDGTTKLQEICYIVIPMLKQAFLMISILVVAGGFKVFETITVLTGGGPNNLSQSLATYMYQNAFTQYQFGYGATLSVVIFLLTIAVSWTFISFINKNEEE